jgi:hypothetical protein
MENTAKNKVDEINTAIDVLVAGNCWSFLDELLANLIQRAWRTDKEELIAYASRTSRVSSKLPSRERFMITCKHLHPKLDWKGLV